MVSRRSHLQPADTDCSANAFRAEISDQSACSVHISRGPGDVRPLRDIEVRGKPAVTLLDSRDFWPGSASRRRSRSEDH
ncbi:hypothetical protein WJX84_002697 [Apatococcus fuscideae]|uniref:Uncharacterized protein n=1 Tax=Apatococcus fuscideae TaxID=2026836 RepID=A0AAW1THZ5_9CHLO